MLQPPLNVFYTLFAKDNANIKYILRLSTCKNCIRFLYALLYACCMLVVCLLYACCMLVVCLLHACCMLVVRIVVYDCCTPCCVANICEKCTFIITPRKLTRITPIYSIITHDDHSIYFNHLRHINYNIFYSKSKFNETASENIIVN